MPEIHYAALPRLLLNIATAEVVYKESTVPVESSSQVVTLRPLVSCTIAGAFVGHGADKPHAWAQAACAAITGFNGAWKPAQYIEGYIADRKVHHERELR